MPVSRRLSLLALLLPLILGCQTPIFGTSREAARTASDAIIADVCLAWRPVPVVRYSRHDTPDTQVQVQTTNREVEANNRARAVLCEVEEPR